LKSKRGAADNSRAAKTKRDQRKRRAAGIEQVSAFVCMPKFTSWLVWEGYLDERDVGDRGKINKALEHYLCDLYWHIGERSDDPPPQYAAGSFGKQYHALRDLPQHVTPVKKNGQLIAFECDPILPVPDGLLVREGATWNWTDPPKQYLITRRAAGLRQAVPPPDSRDSHVRRSITIPPSGRFYGEDGYVDEEQLTSAPDEEELAPDDYDPEEDVEESSADLLDEALVDAFDDEGFERD